MLLSTDSETTTIGDFCGFFSKQPLNVKYEARIKRIIKRTIKLHKEKQFNLKCRRKIPNN